MRRIAAVLLCLLLGSPAAAPAAPSVQRRSEAQIVPRATHAVPAPGRRSPRRSGPGPAPRAKARPARPIARPVAPPPARTPAVDPNGLGIDAAAYVLMDAQTGQVLAAHNPDVPKPPASTTKVLTALLALESLPLTRVLGASRRAAEAREGSSIGFEIGERHTVEDLLRALMLKSANDAAIVIAEGIDGSVERFAERMNRRARELGAERPNFVNPNGLHHPKHAASARDLAVITLAAMRIPEFARLVATRAAAYPGPAAPIELVNRNRLLWQFPGADGVKTGYVDESGPCLIASATRDGRRLIAVILDAPLVFRDARNLLEHGFKATTLRTVVARGDALARFGAAGALGEAEARAAHDFLWAARSAAALRVDTLPVAGLRPPVEAGQVIGQAVVRVDGEIVGRIPLLADRPLRRESVLAPVLRWVLRIFGRTAERLAPPAAAAAPVSVAGAQAAREAIVVEDAAGAIHRFAAPPRRIVSIAPSVTEMLYAIGVEDRVAGVSSSDDFPPRVRDKPRVGGVQIDYERVAALRPDAVIGVRGLQDDVLARLRRAGHVVIAVDGSSVEGARRSVLLLGALTGRSRAAEAVASAMSGRLAAVRRRVEGAVRPRVFVEVWDQPYLTVGRESLVDDLMTIAGGHNVFADVRGWPQVSEEEIVRRAPEVILVLHADAGRVRARAGWRDVPAVRRARVFRVDESLVTRPGPRLGDGAAEIARRLHPEIPWGPLAR